MRSVRQPQRKSPANIDWQSALKIGCFLNPVNPVNPVQDFDFSLRPLHPGVNDYGEGIPHRKSLHMPSRNLPHAGTEYNQDANRRTAWRIIR